MRRLPWRPTLLALPLIAVSSVAMGQAGSTPQAAPTSNGAGGKPVSAAPAPGRLSANYFLAQAIQISEAAEMGLLDGIYASASPVMKAAQGRDAFVAPTKAEIERTGKATGRDWLAVRRELVPSQSAATKGAPPPGEYVVVVLGVDTTPGAGRIETITFHRDADQQFRLCGFVSAAIGRAAPSASSPK